MGRPRVEIIEECMREGMQIESAEISVADKVRLLDALSATGLKTIVVASFVSPKWTPQMADVDELVRRFRPAPGVRYTALALNEKGRERMAAHCPPLSPVAKRYSKGSGMLEPQWLSAVFEGLSKSPIR